MKKQKEQKNKYIVPVLTAMCAVALFVMVAALIAGGQSKTVCGDFIPPSFDISAQSGTPTVSDISWTRVYQDGMDFSANVCGEVVINGGSADIYFTSDAGNKVWLKLRALDETGNILGETGLIRPGEYIKAVEFDIVPANGTKIVLKIMAYEPETYYSAGAVSLNTVLTTGD